MTKLVLLQGRWEYNPNARCDFTYMVEIPCKSYKLIHVDDERDAESLSETDYNNGIYERTTAFRMYPLTPEMELSDAMQQFAWQIEETCYYGGDISWRNYRIELS